ncbi:MAG: hypothetical protein JXR60_09665 [Bacteroidales bacterium]|nr:hypothetical protein [Bacteroidales bacterium]
MRLIFGFLVVFVVALSSCSKTKIENKLLGDWKQISVGQAEVEGAKIVWTFASDHNLYRTTTTETGVTIDTAQWSLKVRFAQKNTLTIENLDGGLHFDGTHLIHQLDDYLEMQRIEYTNGHSDGSFYWSEFEKQ